MTKLVTPMSQEEAEQLRLLKLRQRRAKIKSILFFMLVISLITVGVFIYKLGKPDTSAPVLPQMIGDSSALNACKADTSATDVYWKTDQAYEFKAEIPACAETGCNLRIHGASLGYSLLINEQTRPKLAMWFNATQIAAFNPGFNPQENAPFSGFIAPDWWMQRLGADFNSWYSDNSANSNGADMICIHVPGKDEMAQLMQPLGINWETFNNADDMVTKKGLATSPFDSSSADSLVNQAKTLSLEANCIKMLPIGSVVDENRAELIAACMEKFAGVEVTGDILGQMEKFYFNLVMDDITEANEVLPSPTNTVIPTPTLIPFTQAEEWYQITTFTFDSAVGFAHSENGWSLYQVSVDGRTLFVNDALYCVTNSSCTTMSPGESYHGTGKVEVFPAFADAAGNQYPEHSVLTVWKTRTESIQIYLGWMPIQDSPGLGENHYWGFTQRASSGTVNQTDLATIGLTVIPDDSCGYQGVRATDSQGVTACVSKDDPGLCSNPIIMTAVASGSGIVSCTPNAGSAWPYITICPNGVDISTNIDSSQCWSVKWETFR